MALVTGGSLTCRKAAPACLNHSTLTYLPSLLLTNVNHILNKLDELSLTVSKIKPSIVAITETWLNPDILDAVCSIPSYSIVRKDRCSGPGGGVMFYIRDGLTYHRLDNVLENNSKFEVLFISLRPCVLPRPLSIIIVAVVYCPPWYDTSSNRELCS
jgi:hypothetical protein